MASDRFVSRGGEKLQAAIENLSRAKSRDFKLEIKNLTCLDVGSSTGGFVDCLLQNGAAKVYAVDTAYGELAWKLRNDPRVVVMERTNILYLQSLPSPVIARTPSLSRGTKQSIKEIATLPSVARNDEVKVDLITIDAGWTRLELILPVVKKFLKPNGYIIALLKPHYETDKKNLVKGVVKAELVEQAKEEVIKKIQQLGFRIQDEMESPILGGGGNKEFLLHLTF